MVQNVYKREEMFENNRLVERRFILIIACNYILL